MQRSSTFLATLGLVAAAAIPVSAATFGAGTPTRAIVARVPQLAHTRDLGEAAGSTRMNLAIALTLRNKPTLDALVAAQANPSSPMYRHYLTREQLRDSFGPSSADYARTIASLRRAGFSVSRTSPLRTMIDVTGSVSTIERYFNTSIHRVEDSQTRRTYLANAAPARVPVDAAALTTVGGLSTVPLLQNSFTAVNGTKGKKKSATTKPLASPLALPTIAPTKSLLLGPDLGYSPQALVGDYSMLSKKGILGNGVTVADLLDANWDDTFDVAPYFTTFGIKRVNPTTKFITIDGGCATSFCDDSFGGVIDVESIVGVAPGVNYEVYEVPYLSFAYILDGLDRVLVDDSADIVNISFGGCETIFGESAVEADQQFEEGSALGITFTSVSFGSANPCGGTNFSTQAPADSSFVLSVGAADTSISPETLQPTLPGVGDSGSGGGVSQIFELPYYQKGVVPYNYGRNVPDLAGPGSIDGASPSIYYGSYGGWVGGVFEFPFVNNAPFTGALASIAASQHQRLGNVNPQLYAAFKKTGYTDFIDVTTGCNSFSPGAPFCATAGYDNVTGIGSPIFSQLVYI
ncbi:MAG: hypothetical protein IAI49_01430 [Candidatus Eremiobacteraeota bacterium]|nr:hypothetical protein [Candidatus Eremiobacteraeota bacterium]